MAENKNVLLSVKDLHVKFRVRGRELTAIRGISLDILENESIAIVGESGSGKSVFTKTFAGMLDSNGFVSNGSIVFNDDELADTVVKLDAGARSLMDRARRKLDEYSHLELGAATYRKILELESEKKEKSGLSSAEQEAQEPNIVFSTDFYYHDIFPRWPSGGALSGSMSHPGVCAMHPGDEAILFCLVSRKGHRDTLEELEADLKRKGCPYSIALL